MKIEWKVKESLILICLLPFSSLWQNSQENRLLKKLLLISGFCFCLFLRFSPCSWCHYFLSLKKRVLECSRLKLPTGSGQEKKERAVERPRRSHSDTPLTLEMLFFRSVPASPLVHSIVYLLVDWSIDYIRTLTFQFPKPLGHCPKNPLCSPIPPPSSHLPPPDPGNHHHPFYCYKSNIQVPQKFWSAFKML